MIHPRLATSISVLLVLVVAPTLAGAQTLSRQLVELAPTIRSHDPMIRRFAVDGSIAGKLRFRVTHEKPNRFSLILSDDTDGTPLLMAAEGQSILYDVMHGRLLRFRHFAACLWMFHDAGKGKHGFSFEWDARSHPQDLKVLETIVDLRGMIRAGEGRLVVHRKGETVFALESGPPTSPDRAVIDLSRPTPYVEFRSTNTDGSPGLLLTHITVNEAIEPSRLLLPKLDALAVDELPEASLRAVMAGLEAGLGFAYRLAIYDKTLRKEVENIVGTVDWVLARRRDEAFAPKLREAVGER